MVVIVQADQVSKLKVPGMTGSLTGNTFHSTTVTKDAVGVVVEEFVSWFVEFGTGVCLCDGKTDGIGETLTKGAGCDLDTGGIMGFRVAGCFASNLLYIVLVVIFENGIVARCETNSEVLDVVDGEIISVEM